MDQDDWADAQLWVQLGENWEEVEHVEDVSSHCSPPGSACFPFPGGISFKRHTIFGLCLCCRLAARHFTIHRFIRLLAVIWARPAFCWEHYTLASGLLGIRFCPSAHPDDAFRGSRFEIAEPKGGRGYAGVKNTIASARLYLGVRLPTWMFLRARLAKGTSRMLSDDWCRNQPLLLPRQIRPAARPR